MTSTPTILLDGIWGRPARFGRLRALLEERVGPTEVYHYDCSGLRRFEDLARGLVARVRALGEPVHLIAFSMGGVVARTARLLDPDLPVRRAAFLNVPHRGSLLAYLLPLPGVRQLRPTSDLMRRLAAAPWAVPTLATWCPFDTMIVPGRSAAFPAATRTLRHLVPLHQWPIRSRAIHHQVANFLLADIPQPSTVNFQPGTPPVPPAAFSTGN